MQRYSRYGTLTKPLKTCVSAFGSHLGCSPPIGKKTLTVLLESCDPSVEMSVEMLLLNPLMMDISPRSPPRCWWCRPKPPPPRDMRSTPPRPPPPPLLSGPPEEVGEAAAEVVEEAVEAVEVVEAPEAEDGRGGCEEEAAEASLSSGIRVGTGELGLE